MTWSKERHEDVEARLETLRESGPSLTPLEADLSDALAEIERLKRENELLEQMDGAIRRTGYPDRTGYPIEVSHAFTEIQLPSDAYNQYMDAVEKLTALRKVGDQS